VDGFAERFRQRYPDWTEFIDDAEADEHAALLTAHGLGTLNELVLAPAAIGQVLDRIAEHTAGATLIRRGFVGLARAHREASASGRPSRLPWRAAARRSR
jgi:hypothetical protein